VEPWRIELLGELRAVRKSTVVSHFRTQKTAGLLAYLAWKRGEAQPREVLIDMFWPDLEPENGRNCLSRALSALRAQLEPPGTPAGSVIEATRATVRLTGRTTTDVAELETARSPAEAVTRYKGGLLPGLYDDWIAPERERLRTAFVRAARERVAELRRGGDLTAAIDLARRVTGADPLAEAAHRDLMALHAEAGEPMAALRHYEELVQLLDRELAVAPSAPTRALVREIERRAAAPQAPAVTPARLPLDLTRFFGREEELARVRELAGPGGERLVTLHGPGGIGKTRLALEAARALAADYGDALWFVPLADVLGERALAAAITGALQLAASPREPLERALEAIGRRRALLVLDNFEQLLPAGAATMRTLLERAPGLTCLVTSRIRVGLTGERELPVRPLDAASCLRLFEDRVRAVRPDFAVTETSAPAIAALVERLERIPLAIALAAGRAQVLSPEQLLLGLGERLSIAAREHDIPERHRTLRAAIDWSYRLLRPELQRFFASLSVFRGGFTAEAAAQVSEEPLALDALAELEGCSLMEPESKGRLRLLDTLREFAAEQVTAERPSLEERHASFYRALAEEAARSLRSPREAETLEQLSAEHDNLRAALAASGPTERLALAAALGDFWATLGHLAEGRRHLEEALAGAPDAAPSLRASALSGAGSIATAQGEFKAARAFLEESLALSRGLGDQASVARTLTRLGRAAHEASDLATAWRHFEESARIARELGDRTAQAFALHNLAAADAGSGRLEPARDEFLEALALRRAAFDRSGVATTLRSLAYLSLDLNDPGRARTYGEEALALFRTLGSEEGIAGTLLTLGALHESRDEIALARACYEETLVRYERMGARPDIAVARVNLGSILAKSGEPGRGLPLLQEGLALARELGHTRFVGSALQALARVCAQLGDRASARAHFSEALRILSGLGASGRITWALEALSHLEYECGALDRSVLFLAAAHALRARAGQPPSELQARELAGARELLRRELGDEGFEAAWRLGESLSQEDIVREASAVTA
jgi:predicted ATPase